jgi:hypothetical protein
MQQEVRFGCGGSRAERVLSFSLGDVYSSLKKGTRAGSVGDV